MLRALIVVFLIVVLLEGAIRKWVLPEYSLAVFAIKDIALLFALFAYFAQRDKQLPRMPLMIPWLMWALLSVGYVLLTGLDLEELVGLRYYLAPLPLLLLVPALIRSPATLERVAAWTVRIVFPLGLLAILQYFSPPDSPINAYAWGGEEVAVGAFGVEEAGIFSGAVRPRVTSTFSYISTFASFLACAWLLAWIAVLEGRGRADRALAALALVIILFNMAMNGSRALLLIAALTGLPFALQSFRRLGLIGGQIWAVLIVAAIGYVGVQIFEPFALTAARGEEGEAAERILAALLIPYATLSETGYLGLGIGATFGGFEQLGIDTGFAGFNDATLDRIGLELGVFGYLVYLALKLAMIALSARVYWRAPSSAYRHWALAALLVQLSTGWQIPFYNSVAAIVYFGAIGLIYWIDGEVSRARRTAAHRRLAPAASGALAGRHFRLL
jgi:hypothetical protein